MENDSYRVRVAALWIMNTTILVNILKAHGRDDHAENVEAGLAEAVDIVADEFGRDELTEAISWVADQAWGSEELNAPVTPLH